MGSWGMFFCFYGMYKESIGMSKVLFTYMKRIYIRYWWTSSAMKHQLILNETLRHLELRHLEWDNTSFGITSAEMKHYVNWNCIIWHEALRHREWNNVIRNKTLCHLNCNIFSSLNFWESVEMRHVFFLKSIFLTICYVC